MTEPEDKTFPVSPERTARWLATQWRWNAQQDQPEDHDGSINPSASLMRTEPTAQRHAARALNPTSTPVPAAKKLSAAEVESAFDVFWATYPRRVGKGAARKAFAKICAKPGADPLRIIFAAQAYRDRCREIGKEIQYTPHPTTWLNQERFDDDPEEAPMIRSRTDDVLRQNMVGLAQALEDAGMTMQDIGKPKPPPAFDPWDVTSR